MSEFMIMMQPMLAKETDDDRLAAFRVFDKDNGEIDINKELRFVLSNLSVINAEELEECLEFYNLEKNGKLNLDSKLKGLLIYCKSSREFNTINSVTEPRQFILRKIRRGRILLLFYYDLKKNWFRFWFGYQINGVKLVRITLFIF